MVYGARNLRRTIQRDLEDPISEAIIDSFEAPISRLAVRIEEDKIVLDKE
jgi:ATP-dependent Clp protease ATP-binding subunit ClpA